MIIVVSYPNIQISQYLDLNKFEKNLFWGLSKMFDITFIDFIQVLVFVIDKPVCILYTDLRLGLFLVYS